MMDDYTRHQCDVCKIPHFERNHYFHGKLLGARDLADEQRYFNEKRWLINRMVVGWGVVCGLDVTVEGGRVIVRPGLALDCCGHELLVCEPRTLKADVFIDALGGGRRHTRRYAGTSAPANPSATGDYPPVPPHGKNHDYQTPPPETPGSYAPPGKPGYDDDADERTRRWVLCLEFCERPTEPCKPALTGCDEHKSEYNRVRDDYRLTVRPWRDACPVDHTTDCCPHDAPGRKASLHRALVEQSRACPACEDCDCVVIATGTVDESCQPPEIAIGADSWKYRRLVYTNTALASILRCLHEGLAHISALNWTPGAEFRVDEFLDLLARAYLRVTFDQPMNARSVTNVHSCRLTVFYINEGNCSVQLLVPVQRIDYDENTRTATYYFDDDCIEHELRKVCKRIRKPAEVELILHGSLIHNEEGRALDAELIDELPSGNGVEGGEFIAYFTVRP
jgi:hypothetical protein